MADEAGTREGEAELRWVPAANREIHPAKPAGWSRVGVPSRAPIGRLMPLAPRMEQSRRSQQSAGRAGRRPIH